MTKELLHSLTYASTATELFGQNALAEMLTQSRLLNVEHKVTGLLLYHEGNFIQTIEGSPTAVATLYKNICADPRHYGVLKLIHEPIPARVFPHWSMGFKNCPVTLEGYNDYLIREPELKKKEGLSHGEILLSSFRIQARAH